MSIFFCYLKALYAIASPDRSGYNKPMVYINFKQKGEDDELQYNFV